MRPVIVPEWLNRTVTDLDRLEWSRLVELYELMKHWSEQVPVLAGLQIEELDQKLSQPHLTLEQLLLDEEGSDFVRRLQNELKHILQDWDQKLKPLRSSNPKETPTSLTLALKKTEEWALSYTVKYFPESVRSKYNSLSAVFSGYRESPLHFLYRDSTLILRRTEKEILFATRQPVVEMEEAWMKGLVQLLRPGIQIEQIKKSDSKTQNENRSEATFRWWEK